MGQRNPTRRDLLEHAFPVRLHLRPSGESSDRVGRALRRVLGRQAHGVLGRFVYLASLAHASSFVCACPEASLERGWPVRLIIAFEAKQEGLVRDALRIIVGDAGYALERAGHFRADRPAWHLELACVWDGVQFMRMAQPAQLVAERYRDRNG